jgi:hypothetical protein
MHAIVTYRVVRDQPPPNRPRATVVRRFRLQMCERPRSALGIAPDAVFRDSAGGLRPPPR